jgi:hypothetical protein
MAEELTRFLEKDEEGELRGMSSQTNEEDSLAADNDAQAILSSGGGMQPSARVAYVGSDCIAHIACVALT